jgi:adenosylmethionine-8-amino-7-oxononanoate aminotransferase
LSWPSAWSTLTYPSINAFYFTSGGAEATDTSIKTARFYWKAIGKPDKVKVISRLRAYHGLTIAAMSATGLPAFWPMFEPRVPGFVHIDAPDPYRFVSPDPAQSVGVAAANQLEAAILGRARTPSRRSSPSRSRAPAASSSRRPTTSRAFREICDRHDVLFISDEVITGFGRTGRWFGLEHYGVEPDIMQFAKGITERVRAARRHRCVGSHPRRTQQTSAGAALDARVHVLRSSDLLRGALRNLRIIEDERLVERAASLARGSRPRSSHCIGRRRRARARAGIDGRGGGCRGQDDEGTASERRLRSHSG